MAKNPSEWSKEAKEAARMIDQLVEDGFSTKEIADLCYDSLVRIGYLTPEEAEEQKLAYIEKVAAIKRSRGEYSE
ncbi:MAG: hypothetical protein AAGC72_01195 [Planctomycetota bacterium]